MTIRKFLSFSLVLLSTNLVLIGASLAGELSVAIKEGYVFFKEHRKSVYEHNHVYDNEWTKGGAYVRYEEYPYFVRLDYDRVETGDEFDQFQGFPYEGVHAKLNSLYLSVGRRFRDYFYAGAGLGAGLNTFDVLTFEIHPIQVDYKPTFLVVGYAGAEYSLYKGVYVFGEARYSYQKQRIKFRGSTIGIPGEAEGEFKEGLSNLGLFFGLGWRF